MQLIKHKNTTHTHTQTPKAISQTSRPETFLTRNKDSTLQKRQHYNLLVLKSANVFQFLYFIPIIYVACLQQIKMAPLRGLDKEWLQSWFKITFYCPGYFFPCVVFCLFYLFLFSFFITINSSLGKLAFVLENKTTKLSYHLQPGLI